MSAVTTEAGEARRLAVLAALAESTARGRAPSLRELATALGTSRTATWHHLAALRARGHLAKLEGHRGWQLTPEGWGVLGTTP